MSILKDGPVLVLLNVSIGNGSFPEEDLTPEKWENMAVEYFYCNELPNCEFRFDSVSVIDMGSGKLATRYHKDWRR